jgi:hypothetical protein
MSNTAQFNLLGAKEFFKLHPLTAISRGDEVGPPAGTAPLPVQRTKGNPATGQGTMIT